MTDRPDNSDWEFQLSQYIDGQLDDAQRRRLEERLRTDPALREELRKYQAVEAHLEGLAMPDLEQAAMDSQRTDIMASLERRALLARRRRPTVLRLGLAALAAAAAVAIVVTAAWLVFRSPYQPEQPAVLARLQAPAPAEDRQVTAELVRPPAPGTSPATGTPPHPSTIVLSASVQRDQPDLTNPYAELMSMDVD